MIGDDFMVNFGMYLKDYLEFKNISQTEFAMRMGITQKHMNELLNGKTNVTLEMAANIERLTGINSSFIISVENTKKMSDKIIKDYGDLQNVKKMLTEEYHISELKKNKWLEFKDETNVIQECIDILNFLKIKDFDVIDKMEEQVLFKKTGTDFKKIALWIAHCDEKTKDQKVNEYNSYNFNFLIGDLKEEANKEGINIENIQNLLNCYGIYFACEKAMTGSKIRGCFKVRGKQPAIYITDNYAGKDSFYYELFHELGHCKSDYNEAKNKVIIEGSKQQEERADTFAINTMISQEEWNIINKSKYTEQELLKISQENNIPMSFIVGRLAKNGQVTYKSRLYQKYYKK